MDVIVKETALFDREVTISVPADQVDALLDQELARLATTARLPGFRPGKIKKQVLETRFRDQLSGVVLEQLIHETYPKALAQQSLQPVDHEPKLTLGKVKRGEPFSYTALFQVYPTIEPKGYTGLALTRHQVEISATDVDNVLEQVRTEQSKFVAEAGRPAVMGDQVLLDYDGSIDGERFAGGKNSNHPLELGKGQFIDGFEAQLVGCVAGDNRAVKVTFPTDYRVESLAGKEAVFDCTVHEVRVRVLPPLDDDLATLVGVKEGGLAALRAEIEQTLRNQVEEESRQRFKKALLDQLLQANPLELPSRLVDRECRVMASQAKREYERQGVTLADMGMDETQLAAQFVQPAQERVTLGLLLAEIAEKEKLEVNEADVAARLDEMGAAYGERAAAMKQWVRSSEERMDTLRASVLEQQVIDWIGQNSTVTDKSCTLAELMAQGAE
ncbi:MAG: trigger factor [Magnetococcales bacterium]|nr:trigger factor [Magnetococcales bacterium]